MRAYEVLSRATAFVATTAGRPPVLLASQHVAHPQQYRGSYYFNIPWLEFVTDAHLKHSVEVYTVGPHPCRVAPPLNSSLCPCSCPLPCPSHLCPSRSRLCRTGPGEGAIVCLESCAGC